jgi:hypothetical protein
MGRLLEGEDGGRRWSGWGGRRKAVRWEDGEGGWGRMEGVEWVDGEEEWEGVGEEMGGLAVGR